MCQLTITDCIKVAIVMKKRYPKKYLKLRFLTAVNASPPKILRNIFLFLIPRKGNNKSIIFYAFDAWQQFLWLDQLF